MIQLFHASKTYSGNAPALAEVSLRVGKGELVFLSGASGAGKTTLLKLLFGAERPTSGQVLVEGKNLGRLPQREIQRLRRRIGVVFQDFKLLNNRQVWMNVALPLLIRGLSSKEVRDKVMQQLASVGLYDKAETFPQELSGGEQQRVALARALVCNPTLVLADEPTGNLDAQRSLDIIELLVQASARGSTVLVATHDRSILHRYAERVLLLDKGKLIADGRLESPKSPAWFDQRSVPSSQDFGENS